MKKQCIPLYICLITSAVQLFGADQKPTWRKWGDKIEPDPALTAFDRTEEPELCITTLPMKSIPDENFEWSWGQDVDPDPEIAQQIESRAGQPIIKFPVANIAVRRQWGRGIEANPELTQKMLDQGTQKGSTSLPLASEGPSQSWASIDMTTPAQQPAPQKVRPFVWNEGKPPSQAIIDKFDALAKKGPQRGIASLPSEPSSSDQ